MAAITDRYKRQREYAAAKKSGHNILAAARELQIARTAQAAAEQVYKEHVEKHDCSGSTGGKRDAAG